MATVGFGTLHPGVFLLSLLLAAALTKSATPTPQTTSATVGRWPTVPVRMVRY